MSYLQLKGNTPQRAQIEMGSNMSTKPADWHKHDPEMTISKLVVQECWHESDGSFPITVTCDWLGGDILLEIVRHQEEIFAIYYMSEKTAELWSANVGFKFIENGWQVVESSRGQHPYVTGIAFQKREREAFGKAVELSIDWLEPDVVMTGNYAIPTYLCPIN